MFKPYVYIDMKSLATLLFSLVALVASAQFTGAGYYRVHNAYSDGYICIKGTEYLKTLYPDAFWPCILMLKDSAQVSDPGSIIYIDHIKKDCDLCSQGVSTYTLTSLMMEVDSALVNEGGKQSYVAKTHYEYYLDGELVVVNCIFRDQGMGLQSGTKEKTYSRWWIEPVSEESIEESFFGVKPASAEVVDADGYYWTSLCCDFPVFIPVDGGVVGAYTVKDVDCDDDNCYYAHPEMLYGQGDTIPAATPVLIKCKYAYASGNKLIPVGKIANRTSMPISSDMLMGNYFSNFYNFCNLSDINAIGEYIPAQATKASANNFALGVDEEGRVGFFPKEEGTYMDANTAWLNVSTLYKGITAVYLGTEEAEEEPVVIVAGDANGDGTVDISDLTLLVDYILGNVDNDSEDFGEGADANGDGVINITDVTFLIDKLISGDHQ